MGRKKQWFDNGFFATRTMTNKHYMGADTGYVDRNGITIHAGDEISFDGKLGRVLYSQRNNGYQFYPEDYKLQKCGAIGLNPEDYLCGYHMHDEDWAKTERERDYFDF